MINITFASLPVVLPANKTLSSVITSRFGARNNRNGQELSTPEFHKGVDIAVAKGTTVLAVANGTVHRIDNNSVCGNGIVLLHRQLGPNNQPQRFYTGYCHLENGSITLGVGATVRAGEPIGKSGDTGNAAGHPHLHFYLQEATPQRTFPADPLPALLNLNISQQTTAISDEVFSEITRTRASSTSSDISPYIASLESFHPFIQYELTRRRNAAETANTYTPFVRLTSLVNVRRENLPAGSTSDEINTTDETATAFFPTLGIDGTPEVSFDDIYSTVDPNRSIVGYATQLINGEHKRVKLLVEQGAEQADQTNIPVPGISAISTERSTTGPMGVRGGLFKATINIKAYSIGQLNTLLRYFIRPATRVVLEFGRTSSSEYEQSLPQSISVKNKSQTIYNKFEWKRSIDQVNREDKLDQMIKGKLGQREFIQKYIYNNFGNYEIFIGYVVNFKIKYTKENIYDIELLIHSVQQFEISTKNTGVQTYPSTVPVASAECKTVEIAEYFNQDVYWKNNSFSKLLRMTVNGEGSIGAAYQKHVIPLIGETRTKVPGYLITWEYFVNVVLNNADYGLLSVFQQSNPTTNDALALLQTALIRPISLMEGQAEDLNSNEVAWHESLRSIDPNTMIIWNPSAQNAHEITNAESVVNTLSSLYPFTSPDEKEKFARRFGTESVKFALTAPDSPVGAFIDPAKVGKSSLTKGVWLNTTAIIEAFTSTDTVSMAITKLLNAMNNAVQGYWNLQPLSSEEMSGIYVIDAGMSKIAEQEDISTLEPDLLITTPIHNIDEEVSKLTKEITPNRVRPQYRYMFNRKSKTTPEGDLGSEVLDINVESSLPQVIAVQAIAGVGGVGNNATFAAINIDELKTISIYKTYVQEENKLETETCNDDASGVLTAGVDVKPQAIPNEVAQRILGLLSFANNRDRLDTENIITNLKNQTLDDWVKYNSTPSEGFVGKILNAVGVGYERPDSTTTESRRAQIEADVEAIRTAVREQEERKAPGYLGLVREYGAFFGMAIDLVEPNIAKLAKELQTNKEEYEIHPFNSSNLTKTIVDITLPGIGGIQLWQSFLVDRIPNIIKRGYYVTTKVSHEFTVQNGWITKIQGRFRFKPQRTSGRT